MEKRVKRARQKKEKERERKREREREREKCIKSLVCVAGRVDF